MNKPKMIIIHHSAGKERPDLDDWEAIRKFHTDPVSKGGRGWSNIGYHYGIELVKGVPVIHYGRKPWEIGAHSPGNNEFSLGVCVVGNYDIMRENGNDPKIDALITLLVPLCRVFNIPPTNIFGHYEVSSPGHTVCPGRYFPLELVKREVKERLA